MQILLATYNGEAFLTEQLASLMTQTYGDWTLLARDDQSTDRTPEILREFAIAHPGKVRIVSDNDRLGCKNNFGRLLALSDAPYVMFCDQDDIWLPDKIAVSLRTLQEMERRYGKEAALMVHTDLQIVDDENREITPSLNKAHRVFKEVMPLSRLLMESVAHGCTMLINRALVEKSLPVPKQQLMGHHDSWVEKVAAATGHIHYISTPLIRYRRHGKATSAGFHKRSGLTIPLFARLKKKYARLLELRRWFKQSLIWNVDEAGELLSRFGDIVTDEKRELLRRFVTLTGLSSPGKRLVLMRYRFIPANRVKAIITIALT